jgi:hypothetical protein
MVRVYTKPVSSAELITGIVGTFDIAKLVGFPFELGALGKAGAEVLERMNQDIRDLLPSWDISAKWDFKELESNLTQPPTTLLKNVIKYYVDMAVFINQKAMLSGGAAQIYKHYLDWYIQTRGLDRIYDLCYGYAKESQMRKEEYIANKIYAPEILPPNDLFIMWRKGLISYDTYLDHIRMKMGITKEMAEKWTSHQFYDPGLFDVWRAARNIPVKPEWVVKKLKNIGMNDEDLSVFSKAAMMETVKEEKAKAISELKALYGLGIYTKKEIEDLLTEWEYSPGEKEFILSYFEAGREKTILQMLRDAEIYLFRNNVITADQLYNRLINPEGAIRMDADVANAYVRLEAAKKGVEWVAPGG